MPSLSARLRTATDTFRTRNRITEVCPLSVPESGLPLLHSAPETGSKNPTKDSNVLKQKQPHLSQSLVIKPNPNPPPKSQNLPSPINPSRLSQLLKGYD